MSGDEASPPVSPLEAHLGYWLRYVSNHVSEAFARKLAAEGIGVAEWVMLRLLFDRAASPSELAEALHMTRGAVTKLAGRLIGRQLVSREFSRHDRRFQSLALTGKGRALVPVLAALADANDAEFFAGLSEADRKRMFGILRKIVLQKGLATIPTA